MKLGIIIEKKKILWYTRLDAYIASILYTCEPTVSLFIVITYRKIVGQRPSDKDNALQRVCYLYCIINVTRIMY